MNSTAEQKVRDICMSHFVKLKNPLIIFLLLFIGSNQSIAQCGAGEDMTPPTAVCANPTLYLGIDGMGDITGFDLDGGSSDNCPGSLALAPDTTIFSCLDVGIPMMVGLTVEDQAGNTATCIAIVTAMDTFPPTALCQDLTVSLDGAGTASITSADVDAGSTDNCLASLILAIDISSFTCADVGANVVTLTVTDVGGNSDTCTSTVTVEDNQPIEALCQDITVDLDGSGMVSITEADIDNGSNDNCGASLSLDITDFDCADVGDNTVTLTVTDDNGNTATCTATVTVQDVDVPSALCMDITVQLDAAGMVSVVPGDVDAGSTDNCPLTLSLDIMDFDCGDLGDNTVTLTVDDSNGNTDTCTATVTVEDTMDPVAMCQDITVQLDAAGMASITPGDINNGTTDNCSVNLSLDITDFDCTDIGGNTVTLTATDPAGNSNTCTANVEVEDNLAPMAICQDITVSLDGAGMATILTTDIDNGSNDNCGSVSLSLDITDFDCGDIGGNTVTLTVDDGNGNSSSCMANVEVQDNEPPTALCMDITVALDAFGMVSIVPGDVDMGSSDNCGNITLSLDIMDFTCADVGDNTVTLTVDDNNGNTATCTATVTVEDNIAPTASCIGFDFTLNLDGAGMGSITTGDIDAGSTDNCPFTLSLDVMDFTCADLGINVVTLTVTDDSGNTATCTANVDVQDNEDPTAVCQDITVSLDGAGSATIIAADVDGGSTDNCGMVTLGVDITMFDCGDIGGNTVTLTVTDGSGNTATCTANVEIIDDLPPTALCVSPDLTLSLDGAGMASTTPAAIDAGSSDNCIGITLTLDVMDFTCADLGLNIVTLTVTDDNGNTATCTAGVVIEDNIFPTALCVMPDVTVDLDASGMGSITTGDIDAGSSDNCGFTLSLDVMDFTCADLGSNTVTLSVTDDAGNTSTCTATVDVQDNLDPMAVCQDITVSLDGTGNATIMPADVDGGSSDNCTAITLGIDISMFDCGDIGSNTVTLTVTDGSGNTATCTADVEIIDDEDPMAVCQDITVMLDVAGAASIVAADVDGGSTDNCGTTNLSIDITDFDCSDVGDNTVTLTVDDGNGNSSTCTATVTVEDNIPPVAVCQDITIQLDANGMASITGADIDGGSTDNCPLTLTPDITDFTCADIGDNTVTLTVTDSGGNTDTCTSTVTVEDNIPPMAVCQDITVQLDAAGSASIIAADVDGGSTDNCGITSSVIDVSSFTCAEIGDNTVTLTVTDASGNSSTCTATVTVEDVLPPTAACQDITIVLDGSGMASITAGDIDAGSVDNCGVASMTLDQTDFDCGDVGDNLVMLTVTDVNGNVSTCMATVTVEDNQIPVALCMDITVELDATGNISITGSDIDAGSTDNCPLTLTPDITDFDCMDALGPAITVTLTVTDSGGNTATCTSQVTVEDNMPPMAMCQDITVELDPAGMVSIVPADVNNMSDDNCGNVLIDLDIFDFDCGDVGDNTVTLEVTDMSNNTATCTATVTVEDNLAPTASCQDVTIQLDGAGMASITTGDIDNGSTDNCMFSLSLDQTDFDCSHLGDNTVTLTVTDASGNTSTCTATVTVEDNIPPTAVCQDITVEVDAAGMVSITPNQIDNGSSDNCPFTLTLDVMDFDCDDVGDNTVVLTVTDGAGNTATCSATVTVEDNIPPTAMCQDITVELDASGMVSIVPADVNDMSDDNCGNVLIDLDIFDFDCDDVGDNTVTLEVTDMSGNTATCTATVTVEDNIAPTALCQDITIELDAAGMASITAGDIDDGSFDNCGFSLSIDIMDFTCADLGDNTVTLTVTDDSGNTGTCTSTVTVEDNIIPIALCQDITVEVDDMGMVSITPDQIDNGSSDNCPITLSLDIMDFDCSNLGDNTVVLTVTDEAGNSATCSATVTVEDNIPPTAVCQDITVELDDTGNVSITPGDVDNGSADNCTTISLDLDILDFGCTDLGDNTVVLTVTDGSGNTATCTATITVEDNIPPTITCPGDIEVGNDAGVCEADINISLPAIDDNCPLGADPNLVNDYNGGPDASDTYPVGTTTVIYTITDLAGNTATCDFTVTVNDVEAPTALCQDLTLELDAIGLGSITAADVDNGSFDNCVVDDLSIDNGSFNCLDIGDNVVTLTVTDEAGNTATCTSIVTVEDNIPPTASCQDITVDLDINGEASISFDDINFNSTDNCSIDQIGIVGGNPDLLLTCADQGNVVVTLFVIDGSGNSDECDANVFVQDVTPPTFTNCPSDFTINLDGGECGAFFSYSITAEDACNSQFYSLHQNCSFGADEFNSSAVIADGGGVVCGFANDAVAYSRLYDLPSLGVAADFEVSSVDYVLNFNSPADNVTVNIYSVPAGQTIPSIGSANLLASSSINHPVVFSSTLVSHDIAAIVPLGEQLLVEVEAIGNVFGGTILGMETTTACTELEPTYVRGCSGLFPDFTDLDGFFPFGILLQVNGGTSSPEVPVVPDPGNEYMSGDFLPIGGPYEFLYTATDMAGNISTCSFEVLVLEFPEEDQIVAMACNDFVQISLNEECSVTVGADLILEGGPYGCYDTYTVTVIDQWLQPVDTDLSEPGTQINGDYIGQTLTVSVTDNDTGNSCWGTLAVEDKIIPDLLCGNYEVNCDADPVPGSLVNVTLEETFATLGTVDNSVVEEDLDVSSLEGATISDVNVNIVSDHTWVGDLVISITSPSGTTVELINNIGGPGFGCAGNGLNITLDDEAINDYSDLDATCNNDPAAEGSFKPINALSALDNGLAAGQWTVSVEDLAGGDAGSVTVTLEIQTEGGLLPFPLPSGAYVVPSTFPADYTGPWTVYNFDPCGEAVMSYYEEVGQQTCDGPYAQTNYRYWTITDESGNTTSCIDTINFFRSDIEDLVFPPDWDGIGNNNPPLECDDEFEVDENGHPHPSVTGDIGGPGCFNLNISYEDINVPTCANNGTTYKVLRQWTIIDWCTSTIVEHNQTIKVADHEAPIIEADPSIVSVVVDECSYYLDAADLGLNISDNCDDDFEVQLIPEEGSKLSKGYHDILIQAQDACGNLRELTVELYVRDSVPPIAIVDDELNVSLGYNGLGQIEAESFDEGSYDACGPVAFEVRRIEANPCLFSTSWGQTVEFCCADIAISPVKVEFRVTDHSGNSNTGWVYVTVEDKLPPAILCQPDVTLSCLEDYQQILDHSGSNVADIPSAVTGLIGLPDYAAPCQPELSYTAFGEVDECGFGRIDVTWIVSSQSGANNGCLQRVYIEQFVQNRLNCDDITFPEGSPEALAFGPYPFCEVNDNENDDDDDQPSVDITDCSGPIITEPELDNNQLCTAIGINMSADTFNFAEGACKKIVVHWEVIDQCVYDENYVDPVTGEIDPFNSDNGYFEYYGEYNVFDSEAPVVECTQEILADCTQDFLGPITTPATDNCSDPSVFGWTWSFDLNNDGTIDGEGPGAEIYASAAGLSYFPIGEHRVIWNVNDGCGNLSNGNECIINIVSDDNKAPTPYCHDGLATAVMEQSATVTLWAVDFDAGSTDDCDEDLTFTMIPEAEAVLLEDSVAYELSTTGWTFDCTYLSNGEANEFEVRVYVTDDGGNYDFCRARLRIEDNFDVCPNDGTVSADISGRIVNEHGSSIESADITIESEYPEYPRYSISDSDGEFEFLTNPMYFDYGLSSTRDFDYLNGVSTLDLVLIQKYILGQLSFDSAYKVIAADINGDENVSAIDLLQLRKLILGLYENNDLPNNESWRFVDSDQEFNDINDPWPIDEIKSIQNLIADMENQNLIGVKIGDVNGSAQVSGLLTTKVRSGEGLNLTAIDHILFETDEIRLDISSDEFEEVFGFQFTLNFENDELEFIRIEPGNLAMSQANFGLNRLNSGLITSSWNSDNGVSISKDEVLFSLVFRAKQSGSKLSEAIVLSSDVTPAEAYKGRSLTEMGVELEFRSKLGEGTSEMFELYQNEPNPFNNETSIGFNLPKSDKATLTIYDVTGKVIRVITNEFTSGYNSIRVDRSTLSASGVLYYQLESGDFSATRKMIILE